ncbi:hypothetical protein CICLE_v10017424mg [Citrus x clementina]|uniref:Uncharacterized protein n=1 Tax=Citrus clementina TaxID=85681 RepID=V4TJ83_CITCL|nr:hypothetical protein CICLE_v10017424mg [Citrus x clementina]ESR60509.1 hypothetical protein CICLE_v10017424mg [Citrus x clementina]
MLMTHVDLIAKLLNYISNLPPSLTTTLWISLIPASKARSYVQYGAILEIKYIFRDFPGAREHAQT